MTIAQRLLGLAKYIMREKFEVQGQAHGREGNAGEGVCGQGGVRAGRLPLSDRLRSEISSLL